MVWRLGNIHIHLAGPRTGTAGYALIGVHPHLEKRYTVHDRVKGPQRAEPLAKWAVKHHTGNNDRQQDTELPAEQLAERGAYPCIGQREGDCALQHTLRAEILAEERITHSHLIDNKRRQQHHHDEQHGVFQISQRLQTLSGALGRWDLMQKLLQPAKRAEKAADKPSQQHPQ